MERGDAGWADARRGHLVHQSARGQVLRNTGNYTRGGQLLGSQARMFMGVVRVPLLTWLVIFVAIYWFALSARMGPHEVQLCSWRLIATIWNWADLSPSKPMNLLLPDNTTTTVPMIAVARVPAVIAAWARMWSAFFASVLAATGLTIPLNAWFTQMAKRRGEAVLKDHHERGAMLVPREMLLADIVAHNTRSFRTVVERRFPGLTTDAVLRMPFKRRKDAGLHHPYFLADVPYPYGLEQSHTIVIGTTGAGKTTQLRDLVRQSRQRQDSAVIFDLTGAYVEAFYDSETDVILNPIDTRCPAWSIFSDCQTEAQFTAAAAALVPSDGGHGDPFWITAARTLFVEMCLKLVEEGTPNNKTLADSLMTANLAAVHKHLHNTIADPLTAPEAARMAESIRATFNTNAKALMSLPDNGEPFSIADWIRTEDKPGHILFVTSRYVDLELTKTLLTLWMDLAINTLMTLPRTDGLRTWFIFDELGALHRLPAIEHGLQTARGYGGAIVLGLHSFARLKAIYGIEGAENLTSLARTKLILATADLDSAEACARAIGNREVRQMDEAYSYGYNNLRDASTLTARKQIEPLVLADDITNLPSLHGFIKFPDGFPAARIKLKWRPYPERAKGFSERLHPRNKPMSAVLKRPSKPDDEGPAPTQAPKDGKEATEATEPTPASTTADTKFETEKLPGEQPVAVQDAIRAEFAELNVAPIAGGSENSLERLTVIFAARSAMDGIGGKAGIGSNDERAEKEGQGARGLGSITEKENRSNATIVTNLTADVGGYSTNDPHNHHYHHHGPLPGIDLPPSETVAGREPPQTDHDMDYGR